MQRLNKYITTKASGNCPLNWVDVDRLIKDFNEEFTIYVFNEGEHTLSSISFSWFRLMYRGQNIKIIGQQAVEIIDRLELNRSISKIGDDLHISWNLLNEEDDTTYLTLPFDFEDYNILNE